MLVEDRRDVILCGWAASDFDAFFLGISHAAAYSSPDDGKLKFRENCTHLDEGLAHGIDVAVPAVNHDTAHDDESELLSLDDLHDLAKLLRGSGKAADFQRDNRVALLGRVQQHIQVLLHLGVAMLIFKDDFFGSCGFEFTNLAVDVLFIFIGTATCVPIYLAHKILRVKEKVKRVKMFR